MRLGVEVAKQHRTVINIEEVLGGFAKADGLIFQHFADENVVSFPLNLSALGDAAAMRYFVRHAQVGEPAWIGSGRGYVEFSRHAIADSFVRALMVKALLKAHQRTLL